tara:strand:- start:194543 stop:195226 length:684 start_codon:yes stop_codon:yes gene_type:complete
MKIRILLVDDEALVAERTRILIDSLDNYIVESVAYNYKSACKLIEEGCFDLAIIDINLEEEKSGMDLAQLLGQNHKPFIYLTSFADQDTLATALEFNPIGYSVKPINKNSLFADLEMARLQHIKKNIVIIKEGKREIKLNALCIYYIKSSGNYCEVQSNKGTTLIRSKLLDWHQIHPDFQQIHRSYVVNNKMIISKSSKGLILKNGELIPWSSTYSNHKTPPNHTSE